MTRAALPPPPVVRACDLCARDACCFRGPPTWPADAHGRDAARCAACVWADWGAPWPVRRANAAAAWGLAEPVAAPPERAVRPKQASLL